MTVYGLPNCDTTRAAIKWLKQQGISFEFRDVKQGISKAELEALLQKLPLDKLLNKKSTTWRSLSTTEQQKAQKVETAITLLQENTSLIKRPAVIWPDGDITAGFSALEFNSKAGE